MLTVPRKIRHIQLIEYLAAVGAFAEVCGDHICHHAFAESARSCNADVLGYFTGSFGCVEWTRLCLEQTEPALVALMPSRKTFERYIENEIEEGVKIMARYGDKAYNDRAMPFIVRDLENMYSNDWWVADNHTLDIISLSPEGVQHRLSMTVYLDARSGMPTGWNFTDNPNGQSTILALRNGIMRCSAIPTHVYIDNGREFLIKDVGGLGHRQHKSTAGNPTPPPIFERLGIEMSNALVRNAKAKVIERAFRDFTEWFAKLFDTYTGGRIDKRPECLKKTLKSGRIPTDEEVKDALNKLIEGMWCHAPYGGDFPADKGLVSLLSNAARNAFKMPLNFVFGARE